MVKKFLLIALLTTVIGGVVYYFSKETNSPATQISPTSSTPSPITEVIVPENVDLKCQTSDQCIIVSESIVVESAKNVKVQCTNKNYLESCKTCKVDSKIITETKAETTCECVKNICQFGPSTNP